MAMTSFKKKRLIAKLLKLYDGEHCYYCGREFEGHLSKARTLDHLIPKSRGGPDELCNLVFACSRCNNLKGDRTWWEWINSPDYKRRRAFAEKVRRKKPPRQEIEVIASLEFEAV